MKLGQRVGPFLHATLHSYNAAFELVTSPLSVRRARRDAGRLVQRMPFLADYRRLAEPVWRRLAPVHRDYVSRISPAPITLSLPLAVFATVLCEQLRPGAILDLGSGFSSYAFRQYAGQASPRPVVHSVDDSADWLEQTAGFLRGAGVDTDHLQTWQSFTGGDGQTFDLVLYDIGTLAMRLDELGRALAACRPGGLFLIDDMHVPRYRWAIERALRERGLPYFSARAFTRKNLRYAYVVTM